MHAETSFGNAVLEFIQKRDAARGFVDVDLHSPISHFGVRGEFFGEGVVMRSEKPNATDVRGDVVEDRLRDRDTVIGRRAAPEFVEDDEGSWGSFRKDLFGFREFNEKGRLCGKDIVIGAKAGHDTVDGSKTSRARRNITPDLSHDYCDTGL